MCGIAGVVGNEPADLAPLEAMTRALRHRGPDDEGYVVAESATGRATAFSGPDTDRRLALPRLAAPGAGCDVGLGHRRLAILDLSPAGHGPMPSPDGRFWLTYNGEVYNYLELRSELASRGHAFSTGTDTEVLLAAWREWGPEALSRLNGMWAFALLDLERRALYCARDRYGVKPLYHHRSPDGRLFAFGSEIKSLLAHPGVPRLPNEDRLAAFLSGGAIDEGEETFVEGVRALRPGHWLELDLRSRRLVDRAWYALPDAEPTPCTPGELLELLESAVRLRLRSDVDVGSCLSGGLDSSSIVALCASVGVAPDERRRSFTVAFSDEGIDERRFTEAVVEATGVRAAWATPTADELERDLPALVDAQDEPFASPGVYAQFRVMALAREAGVKVLLDGQGADELLGGYHYQAGPFLAERLYRKGPLDALRRAVELGRGTGRGTGFMLGLTAYHALPLPGALRRWAVGSAATHSRVPEALLAPGLAGRSRSAEAERHRPRRSLLEERRLSIARTSLPALLRYEDRNSMAFAIEARTPFLDYRLVERLLRVPSDQLIREGWTKWLLREAMRGRLPDAVRWRRDKLGFAVPERSWLAALAPRIRAWLGSDALLAPRLDSARMRRWLAGDDGALARRPGLWRLVSAELWLRRLAGRAL